MIERLATPENIAGQADLAQQCLIKAKLFDEQCFVTRANGTHDKQYLMVWLGPKCQFRMIANFLVQACRRIVLVVYYP